MIQGKQNPVPSASAQEIAESHAFAFWKLYREYLTSKRTITRPALDRAFLSAITAAVADRDTRIKNLEEFIRETQCRCEPEIGNQCERCYLLREGSLTAVVAQAKEEEKRSWSNFWALFHKLWGQNKSGDYSKATWMDLQALVKALELKEPAIESNLSTQNDLVHISVDAQAARIIRNSLCQYADTRDMNSPVGGFQSCVAFDLMERIDGAITYLSEHSNAAVAPLGKQEAGE